MIRNPRLIVIVLVIFTVISIQIPKSSCIDDAQYTNCSTSYSCGSLEITYPFWGGFGNRPEYCGYPGFEVACANEILKIDISSITYRVLAVDNSTQLLTVARDDYWDGYCPTHLRNVTLDYDIFSYGQNYQNLSLYYGCPTGAPELANQFTCTINGASSMGYYLTRDQASAIGNALGCNDLVMMPVLETYISNLTSSPSVTILQTAIKGGFGLVWEANNSLCHACVGSGGQCGYAVGTGGFVCYCSDKPYSSKCGTSSTPTSGAKPEKSSTRVVLIIGISLGGAAILGIALVLLLFCIKRRKQKVIIDSKSKGLPTPLSSNGFPTPTTNFSRTTPSYPSSLSTDLEKGGSMYFGVQVFTYNELEEATEKFNPARELGDGGFGVVYKGNLHDGRVVAVKRLYENNFKRVQQFINEVEILARLRHQNLVSLYGCTSRKSQELLLVYEYIPNGTVADHLHGNRANSGLLTWPVRLSIAIESASALTYLHKSDVIHRDVKTNNILLDNDFRVKVADFGLSRLFPTDVTHVSTAPQGTPGYVDPEYYQCYQITDKSDVYSFGVVLVELITSLQAVDTNRHRHDINLSNMAISKIQNHTLHELVDPCLGFETDSSVRRMTTLVAELAFQCLQQDRDMRPSMEEVVACLKAIEKEEMNKTKPEVVDIHSDDVGLLKSMPPSFSPNSDRWANHIDGASSF